MTHKQELLDCMNICTYPGLHGNGHSLSEHLGISKHGQNGRGERTRGGIVLLARERNFPKNSQ